MKFSASKFFRSFAAIATIVLPVIAISPAQAQDLTETEKLNEALSSLSVYKISVAEFYAAEGEWPSAGEEGLEQIQTGADSLSDYLSSVTLGANGQILATLANVVAGVNGGVIEMTPAVQGTRITFGCTSANIAAIYLPESCNSTAVAVPKAHMRLSCGEYGECVMRVIGIRGISEGSWDEFWLSVAGGYETNSTTAEITFIKSQGMFPVVWTGTTGNGDDYELRRHVRVSTNRAAQVFDRVARRLNPRERFFPRGRAGDVFKKGDLLYYKLIARTEGTRVGVQMRLADGRWYPIGSLKSLPVRNGSAVARLRIPETGRYRIVVYGGARLGLATGLFLESTATPLR